MRLKGMLTAVTVGAGLLVWMMAPMASASTTTATNSVSSVTKAPRADAPDQTETFYLANLTGHLQYYGFAMAHGWRHKVTLEKGPETTFSYSDYTGRFQQVDTDLCLEYNASSTTYPVRMDTCTDGRTSQEWFRGLNQYQLENGYSGTCLEGSEVGGYGIPLTMARCSLYYAGQDWDRVFA